MERIPAKPPHIAPLPTGTIRPLWSVKIPVYNCSQYLENCLLSVLLQAPDESKMQIEVIDDHSNDADISELVNRVGKGRVKYFRKDNNMGSVRNFETCINRAKGQYVHILHGDDFVLEGYYKEVEHLFTQYPEIGAAFTDFNYVGEQNEHLHNEEQLLEQPGILKDWLNYMAVRLRIQPPSMTVKRTVYEHLGSFFAVKYGEDWEMWTRIAAHYPVGHSPAKLACYRVHKNNITGNSLTSGENIRDINTVINIIQNYLPRDKKYELRQNARKNFAIYFAWISHKLYHDYNNKDAAKKQIKGALAMHLNRTTLLLALKLYVKLLIRYKSKG